jgi:energy-coupling factor transporter transmembrane protein EcfT
MVPVSDQESLYMRLSMKLGIASLALLGLSAVLAVLAPQLPLAFVAGFLACVLGALAAQRGTKWWLAVPCVLVALFLLILYVGFHAV